METDELRERRIAFVGVGRMGANMARCLKERGYSISAVYDARQDVAINLAAELHCECPRSLAAVTESADVVFTVVSDDGAMKSIFKRRRDNLLRSGTTGKIFINCATVSPSIYVEVERLCAARNAASLEACMASSIPQAREGSLYLMIGGNETVYEEVSPLLRSISSNMRYIGPAGSAALVKALVNMVMNINTAALAEGLALGSAYGIDLTLLREVFSATGANSRVLETDGEDMQMREHSCFFSAEHAAKDSSIAAELAKKARVYAPLNRATLGQYRKMIALGLGELDKSGIAELTFPGRRNAS